VSEADQPIQHYDVVVIGAGFAGMYMLYSARQVGMKVRVFEAGEGVGGTWFWNRYPGARVDGDSLSYSYGFDDALQQEWSWTEVHAPQPELLAYANHVADRFDLRRDVQFNTTVTTARWDDPGERWAIETDCGDRVTARFLVTAVGCLSAVNVPPFTGLERFNGSWYHTARWPEAKVDFSGQRVGVIGTGSTGIQVIPEIAKSAGHLHVFQRTPHFAVPSNNRPMDPDWERKWKAEYSRHRQVARGSAGGHDFGHLGLPTKGLFEVPMEECQQALEQRWHRQPPSFMLTFTDIRTNLEANAIVAEFVRNKIRGRVKDPVTAELLCPKSYPIGAKRICLETNYYETFNRANVTLVDVMTDPIQEITENGVRTRSAEYHLETLVFATGFDAITGPLLRINPVGRAGISLTDKWDAGPRTYLGLMIAGFPNLFTITGPGSPSVLANVITAIEQHVEWITTAIVHMRDYGYRRMEATMVAEARWADHVNEVGEESIYRYGNSWYRGANIPGKPRTVMPYVGGMGVYVEKCEEVAARGYDGFVLN